MRKSIKSLEHEIIKPMEYELRRLGAFIYTRYSEDEIQSIFSAEFVKVREWMDGGGNFYTHELTSCPIEVRGNSLYKGNKKVKEKDIIKHVYWRIVGIENMRYALKKADEAIAFKIREEKRDYMRMRRRNENGLTRRAQSKQDLIEEIKRLHSDGMKQKDIATKLNINKSTVSKYLKL